MSQNPLKKYKTKSGKDIKLSLPKIEHLPEVLKFINRLVDEDTFLSLCGKHKTLEEERAWLIDSLEKIKFGKSYHIFAICNNQIVGSCDIHRGITREWHIGKIGLMIDKDFRSDGIGKTLLLEILQKARLMKIRIVTLDLFSDNNIALSLYRKCGFKKYGLLPQGLYRKNKFSNTIMMYKNLL